VENFLIGKTLYVTFAITLDIFCVRPFALHLLRQQTEKDMQNVDFAPPPGKISADAHGCVFIQLAMNKSRRVSVLLTLMAVLLT